MSTVSDYEVITPRKTTESSYVFAPTGLRLVAQGCRALAATLGKESEWSLNRNAVATGLRFLRCELTQPRCG